MSFKLRIFLFKASIFTRTKPTKALANRQTMVDIKNITSGIRWIYPHHLKRVFGVLLEGRGIWDVLKGKRFLPKSESPKILNRVLHRAWALPEKIEVIFVMYSMCCIHLHSFKFETHHFDAFQRNSDPHFSKILTGFFKRFVGEAKFLKK